MPDGLVVDELRGPLLGDLTDDVGIDGQPGPADLGGVRGGEDRGVQDSLGPEVLRHGDEVDQRAAEGVEATLPRERVVGAERDAEDVRVEARHEVLHLPEHLRGGPPRDPGVDDDVAEPAELPAQPLVDVLDPRALPVRVDDAVRDAQVAPSGSAERSRPMGPSLAA